MGVQGLLRLTESVGGQIQPGAGVLHGAINRGEGVYPALEGFQLRPSGQGAGGGLQGLDPVPGGGGVQTGALHLAQLIGLVGGVVAGQQGLRLLQLGTETVQSLLPLVGGSREGFQLGQSGAQNALLLLQLG